MWVLEMQTYVLTFTQLYPQTQSPAARPYHKFTWMILLENELCHHGVCTRMCLNCSVYSATDTQVCMLAQASDYKHILRMRQFV